MVCDVILLPVQSSVVIVDKQMDLDSESLFDQLKRAGIINCDTDKRTELARRVSTTSEP